MVLEIDVVGVEPEVGLKPEVRGGVVGWVGLVMSGLGCREFNGESTLYSGMHARQDADI